MSKSTVACDRARLADGQEISIEEATSGTNGYFCLGCGGELKARKGDVNDYHFAHHRLAGQPASACTYTSETYRHDLAKRILQHRKSVRVPAVHALRPEGYTGRLPQLAEARLVEAAYVELERNVYVDDKGEIGVEPHQGLPFDDHQGRRVALARPDVIFYNAQHQRILLIEIYATHKVNEAKLARLYTLGVDAIEIYIPRYCDPEAIDQLFDLTSNTKWLYNEQQANYRFLAPDSGLLAGGSAPAAADEKLLSGRRETTNCRAIRLDNALLGIRNCLGRADINECQQTARTSQRTGEEFTAGLEAQRDERDERLGQAERTRVANRRAAFATRERELAAEAAALRDEEAAVSNAEAELAAAIRADEGRLRAVVSYLEKRIKRAENAAEDEYNAEVERIELERARRRAERSELIEQEAAVGKAERRLDPDRAELERQERILATAAETNRRGLARATTDLGAAELATQVAQERKAALLRIKNGTA